MKLITITALSLMITSVASFATNGNGSPSTINFIESPFVVQEEVAQFPGGDQALQVYVKNHINYPVVAREQGIEGRVIVALEVDEKGQLTNIKVIQGIGGGCEEEVVRVLTEMPDWKPAIQAGNHIKTKKIFSFNFQL